MRLPMSSNIFLRPRAAREFRAGGPPGSITQEFLERSLWQRYEKPQLEHQESQERHQRANANRVDPGITPQPPHEGDDQNCGGNVDAEIGNGGNIDCRRDHHREHELELTPACEEFAVVRGCEYFCEVHRACDDDGQTDVERKESGFRSLGTPADADLQAAIDSDKCKERHERGHSNFHTLVGRTCPTKFFRGVAHHDLKSLVRMNRRLSWCWPESQRPSSGPHAASLRWRPTWRIRHQS